MTRLAILALAACSSSPAPTKPTPAQPPDAAIAAPREGRAVTIDAAPPPDAFVDTELEAAVAQVFRFNGPGRLETWTLRHVGARAQIVVERNPGKTSRYTGIATDDGKTLTLALDDAGDKLSLVCKREKLAVVPASAQPKACKWPKAASIEVLQCKHPDFAAPMPFLAAPGVEYVLPEGCGKTDGNYRKL